MAQHPNQIGPYPVLGILGEGGMGSVYLSRDPESGDEVAVKVLGEGRRATPAQRKRFEREVRALGQLRHPNLVELLGSGEERGLPWLAMRRVAGEDLSEFLRTSSRLPPRDAAELGIQIGSALAAAHAVGILHRDLKPDNVLRTPEGRYVLTDFGLTKELERDESVRLSQTGVLQGTPGYWAPEQAEGSQSAWSFATDVYGLGALLYAALTGVPPIQGKSLIEIVISTRERAPDPPSRLVPATPLALDRIVLRCLEKSPEDRYESLEAVVDELEAFLYGPAETSSFGRRAGVVGGLGVLLLLVGLGGGAAGLVPEGEAPSASAVAEPAPADRATELYDQAQAKGGAARIELLRRAANLGHGGALYELGAALAKGSPGRSRVLFERAAKAGEPRGMAAWGRLQADERGSGDPVVARVWLRRALEAGELAACVDLARLLAAGRGGALDPVGARALLLRGAEGGDLSSMAAYGSTLQRGLGGPQDREAALAWLRRSAKGGDPAGIEGLATAYREGWGVQVDLRQAFTLFTEAAAAGRLSALRSLGTMHLKGQGTEPDPEEAFRCYLQAAEAGYLPACHDVGVLYHRGIGTPKDHDAANRWQLRGAEGGDPLAMFALGVAAERGAGLPKDPEFVKKWYRRSAEKGYPLAMYNLAVLLERSELGRSVEWYRKAAKAGYPPAIAAMGELSGAGKGVPKDEAAARGYFERAAELGDAGAAYNLGLLWARGLGGPLDASQAARWLLRSAQAGYGPAMGDYGKLLRDGWGVKKDLVGARIWLERGAGKQDPGSMCALGRDLLKRATAPGGKVAQGRRAIDLLARAVRARFAPAMFLLARELQSGRFVQVDSEQAYRLLQAGAQQNLDCLVAQADALLGGVGVTTDKAGARSLYRQAADLGRTDALGILGTLLLKGHGGPRDVARGAALVDQAAQSGDRFSCYTLGHLYDTGLGFPEDPAAAREWYLRAAKAGDADAMSDLAKLLIIGRGGPQDDAQGLVWLKRAAELGSHRAMLSWGARLAIGEGVSRDRAGGRAWVERALESESVEVRAAAQRALKQLEELDQLDQKD